MKNPRKLHYTYYHCTRSQNPTCAQRGIERKELEKQVIQSLGTIRLPLLHELWLDHSFARFRGSREELKTLAVIRELFATATPDVQRQVAMAVFTGMTLTNQKVIFSLKSPFLFRELQLPSSFEQNPFQLPSSWHWWQCGRGRGIARPYRGHLRRCVADRISD